MRGFLERPATGKVVDALLIINAILLAALTFPELSDDARSAIEWLDRGIFAIFIVELLLRIAVYRREFFHKGWNIFDFVIITASMLSYGHGISALRTLRVLRLAKIISNKSVFARIIGAFLHSIKGVLGTLALGLILNFIFAIMACNLFGKDYPDLFGDMVKSLYSLMKLSLFFDWDGVAAAAGAQHSALAFFFFITYFLLVSFVIINLFVAVVYDAYYLMKAGDEPTPATPPEPEPTAAE